MSTVFTPAPPKGEPGTLIHGTMRAEDLIPAFLAECDRLRIAVPVGTRAIAEALADPDAVVLTDYADDAMTELMDCLSLAAPFGHYFGANVGDGADYGYWLTEEWTDALEERGINESDWEAVLSVCEGEGIEPESFCDAWQGEVDGYTEEQAGAAYAQQTAEDCGMIDDSAKWPHNCINWEEAWRQLAFDGYSAYRLGAGRYAIVRLV